MQNVGDGSGQQLLNARRCYKSLRTAEPVTKKGLLWQEYSYIGSMRNIGRGKCRNGAREQVVKFCID